MIFRSRFLFELGTWISILGVAIGVSALMVSMAVVSGFETTLSQILADVSGHLRVVVRASQLRTPEGLDSLEKKFSKIDSRIIHTAKYSSLEAVAAANGRISGVLLQGLEELNWQKVLRLEPRVVSGSLTLLAGEAAVGKSLAERLNLKVNDDLNVVVPIPDEIDPSQFRRAQRAFKVQAILDLGKYEFDNRMVLVGLKEAQNLIHDGGRFQGWVLRTTDVQAARAIGFKLGQELGSGFFVSDWREINETLFEAVRVERVVIFFVVLVILLAACMNISSTMYIHVIRRIGEISVLRSMGHQRSQILFVIAVQGLLVSGVGLILGLCLGLLVGQGLEFIQTQSNLLPLSVYKIAYIHLDFRWSDLGSVMLATLIVSLLSALAPAWRGSRIFPAEGLKYD